MKHATISRLLVRRRAGSLSSPRRAPRRSDRGPGARHSHAHPPSEGRFRSIRGDGRHGDGLASAVRGGDADGRVPRRVPLRFRDHDGRQHHRGRHACGHGEQVRDPLQAAPRRRSRVPCRPRQPRQPEPAFLRALQHGRRALLHLPGVQRRDLEAGRRRRALLRPRHHLPGPAAARLAGEGAFLLELRLEDRVLPSSPVLVGQGPRLLAGGEGGPGAPLRQVRCERRVLRARPRLRAHQAPEGRHRVLGVRSRWPVAHGGPPRHGHDRQGVRHATTTS